MNENTLGTGTLKQKRFDKTTSFREKKYLNKRLYFLIDETQKKILFVAFAAKKQQQEIINFIKLNKEELLDYLKKV